MYYFNFLLLLLPFLLSLPLFYVFVTHKLSRISEIFIIVTRINHLLMIFNHYTNFSKYFISFTLTLFIIASREVLLLGVGSSSYLQRRILLISVYFRKINVTLRKEYRVLTYISTSYLIFQFCMKDSFYEIQCSEIFRVFESETEGCQRSLRTDSLELLYAVFIYLFLPWLMLLLGARLQNSQFCIVR
ncbi:hypothetical protein V1511DRAFT_65642 [Dipodascopsis uninucleata]